MTDTPIDAYKILQVDPEAEDEVIQAAYRRLAQKYHPDVSRGATESSARMAAINRAWETLRDPVRRRAYDRERRAGRHPVDGDRYRPSPSESPTSPTRPSHRAPETVSSDWTTGRSTRGGGYDAAEMGAKDGLGAAGRPPGHPSGSILGFGRYAGWSLGEIASRDLDYIEWLDRMPIGRSYRDELDAILRQAGRRKSAATEAQERRGLFRRR
jgi:curved DNA-binding protein CbpA